MSFFYLLALLQLTVSAELPQWPLPMQLPLDLDMPAYVEDYYTNGVNTFVVVRLVGVRGAKFDPVTAFEPLSVELVSDAGIQSSQYMQLLLGDVRGEKSLHHRLRFRFAGAAKGRMVLRMSWYKDPKRGQETDLGTAGSDIRPYAVAIRDTWGYILGAGYEAKYFYKFQVPIAAGTELLMIDQDRGSWQGEDKKWNDAEVVWVRGEDGRVLAVKKDDLAPLTEGSKIERDPGWEIVSLLGQLFELANYKPVGNSWRKGTVLADMGIIEQDQGEFWVKVTDPDGNVGYIYQGSDTEPGVILR